VETDIDSLLFCRCISDVSVIEIFENAHEIYSYINQFRVSWNPHASIFLPS